MIIPNPMPPKNTKDISKVKEKMPKWEKTLRDWSWDSEKGLMTRVEIRSKNRGFEGWLTKAVTLDMVIAKYKSLLKAHKHRWQYTRTIGGWSSLTHLWLKRNHEFVCDCGLVKLVEQKEGKWEEKLNKATKGRIQGGKILDLPKPKENIISLGLYKEDNFSSREALAEEVEEDTKRMLKAKQEGREEGIKETIKFMKGKIIDMPVGSGVPLIVKESQVFNSLKPKP